MHGFWCHLTELAGNIIVIERLWAADMTGRVKVSPGRATGIPRSDSEAKPKVECLGPQK